MDKLTKLLSEDSQDAILQIRFQIQQISFFQGPAEFREDTTEMIDQFKMWIGMEDVERIQLLDQDDLMQIQEKSQRYELPRNSLLAKTIISKILNKEDVVLTIQQEFRISQELLYSMDLEPAGLRQRIQPEVVINALEVAASSF